MFARLALVLFVSIAIVSCSEIPTTPAKVGSEALLAPSASPQGLVVTPANPTILIGQNLTLTVKNANGSAINKTATWTSSNPSIASVVSTGTGTAKVTGLASGTVTITATSSNKSGSTTVTVVPVPVRSVTLSPDSARVELGDQVQYSAVPRDSAGNALNDRVTTWTTTDASIATINNTGLATTHARGSTRVIATIEGKADTTWLIVNQTPARVELTEHSILFDALGETKQMVANVYDSRNNLIPDAVVTWATDSAEIATVNSSGVVTPHATSQSGWTFVHASLGALSDTATVTVYRWAASIVASPDTMRIAELAEPGEISGQFTAVNYDRNGFAIEGGWILWEVMDPGPVSVSMDGSVVATGNGTARVIAISFGGVQDTVVVIVDAPPPEPLLLSSDSESAWLHSRFAAIESRRKYWAP